MAHLLSYLSLICSVISFGLVGTRIVSYALRETKHDLVLVDNKPLSSVSAIQSVLEEHKDRVQLMTVDLTIPEVIYPRHCTSKIIIL